MLVFGSGASVLAEWGAAHQGVPPPLAKALMIDTYGLKNISVVSRGRDASASP